MQTLMPKPSLYGLDNSNRNFQDPYYWGKNQFNSSFPLALACYMRDSDIDCVYIELENSKTKTSFKNFDFVFGSDKSNKELFFSFESRFEPFAKYVHDDLEPIDCVIKAACSNEFIRALEIKLTTLPDDATSQKSETDFGCEIVVRSPTMRYMALSMIDSLQLSLKEIRTLFEPICYDIRNWDNAETLKSKKIEIFKTLDIFFNRFSYAQKPLLLQPIWKTNGKSPELAENCLDIFVWSDFALSSLFMGALDDPKKITRPQRAALRLARFLYEASSGTKVYQKPIYDGMTYDTLNDKEFAIGGQKTNPLMRHDRLKTPIICKNEIKNIILGGGQKYLSPERRFDAILYFAKDLFNQ